MREQCAVWLCSCWPSAVDWQSCSQPTAWVAVFAVRGWVASRIVHTSSTHTSSTHPCPAIHPPPPPGATVNVGIDPSKVIITKLKIDKDRKVGQSVQAVEGGRAAVAGGQSRKRMPAALCQLRGRSLVCGVPGASTAAGMGTGRSLCWRRGCAGMGRCHAVDQRAAVGCRRLLWPAHSPSHPPIRSTRPHKAAGRPPSPLLAFPHPAPRALTPSTPQALLERKAAGRAGEKGKFSESEVQSMAQVD